MKILIETATVDPDPEIGLAWGAATEYATTKLCKDAYAAQKAALKANGAVREHLCDHDGVVPDGHRGGCLVNEAIHEGGQVIEPRTTLKRHFEVDDDGEPLPKGAERDSKAAAIDETIK